MTTVTMTNGRSTYDFSAVDDTLTLAGQCTVRNGSLETLYGQIQKDGQYAGDANYSRNGDTRSFNVSCRDAEDYESFSGFLSETVTTITTEIDSPAAED